MMPVTEEWRRGFAQRIRAVHELWQRTASDLTLAHVNHVERSGVLPIAFSLIHYVGGEDRNATELLRAGPVLWESWSARVRLTGEPPKRGTPMAEAERLRIGDVDAWRAYQSAVFARTERGIAALPLAAYDELMFDGLRPEFAAGSFLAALVPEGPVRRNAACEAYIYQHAVRHLGELDHARALVGLGGIT